MSSGRYYYGEATAQEEQEARDRAMKQIVEQIAVKVSSDFNRTLEEKNGDISEVTKNVINTYSNATLSNLHFIKNKTEAGIEVFCYIDKSEVVKIFDQRKTLVKNIYEKGMACEENRNIADALKYYYFCIILMNSIPEKTIEYQSKNLLVEIPARINKAISQVKFFLLDDKKISDSEREVHLEILFNEQPVQMLDFTFWDGASQVNVRGVDGTGVFRLYGASAAFNKLNVEIKYNYYDARTEITEVADLWNLVVRPTFKNNYMIVLEKREKPVQRIIAKKEEPSLSNEKTAQPAKALEPPMSVPTVQTKFGRFTLQLTNKENSPVANIILENTKDVIEIIDQKNNYKKKYPFASDPFLMNKFSSMVKYNSPVVIDDSIYANINKTINGWEMRKVRLLTFYPSLNKQSMEYLTFDFDEKGILYDFNFGTVEQLYEQFVEEGKYGNDWGNRQVIVKFMERYRTAYMTRNMSMLDSLFADEAVIIIGRQVQKSKKADSYQYARLNAEQPDYEYMQYTKNQYLKNQEKVFRAQKDIALGFSSFKITRKNNMPGTYGISMKQYYTSTTYADEGHLFLLVDFLQAQPQIYVRSWQPNEWNDDAMVKLANFRLNR